MSLSPTHTKEVYKTLIGSIEYETRNVSNKEEVVVSFILPNGETIVVQKVGFKNPHFIVVVEKEIDGHSSTYYLSPDNINFFFTKIKKQEDSTKKTIGFLGSIKD